MSEFFKCAVALLGTSVLVAGNSVADEGILSTYAAGEGPAAAAGAIAGDGWEVTGPERPDPACPNILLVGDSILGGYGPAFRTLAAGHANVYTWNMAFFATPGVRGIPTDRVNAVSAVADFAWVVFNNGLHSYHWNEASVSDEDVALSYRTLVAALAAANPDAQLYYLATTPHTGEKVDDVVSTFGEHNEVMKRLNRFAQAEMAAAGIPYLDAYALLAPHLGWAAGDHFHWNSTAYTRIAQFVASALGWFTPEPLATVEVDSAISKQDYCAYHHAGSGVDGTFGDKVLYVGQGPGTPYAFYSSFFFPGFPSACFTAATAKMPVVSSNQLNANLDVWGLGYRTNAVPSGLASGANIHADTDTTAWLNGRSPTKLADDLIPANVKATGTLTADVTDYAALLLNRAGKTNGWGVVRLNMDAALNQGDSTSLTYTFGDANTKPNNACRFTYRHYAEPFAAPLPSLPSMNAVRTLGRWAHCATAQGVSMPLVATCGRVNGEDTSVVLRFDLPSEMGLGLQNVALDLVVAPTGAAKMSVPAGVNVDVWALGVETVGVNDDCLLNVNPFLAGTADTRKLLNGEAPVRLGTLVTGGGVLVPGSTLIGSDELRANLVDYLAPRLGTGLWTGTGVRQLVLRLNATAPSAANAPDWGFGVGSVVTPGVASMLEVEPNFTLTALPDAENGVVTIRSGLTVLLTEEYEIPDTVTNIVISSGASLIFDISDAATAPFDVLSSIKGAGTLVKRGMGALRLRRASATAYNVASINVEQGDLHLPEFAILTELELKKVNIAEGARLFMAGSDTVETVARTRVCQLSGLGLVTNGWAKAQTFQQDTGYTSTFEGAFGGKLKSFWVYPSGVVNLTGTESTFTYGDNSLPGFGSIGAVKIGYDANDDSSLGHTSTITLGPNGGNGYSKLTFLGTSGETTVKTLKFAPWTNAGGGGKCILDAGLGGLVWNGNWTPATCAMVWAVIQGDGAATNVMGGVFNETTGSTYLEKLGAGTWFLKPSRSGHKGVTAVKEGKLLFETLRERGTECSLGLSTLTHSAYWKSTIDDSKAVPYAFLLGGGSQGEAVLECVGQEGSTVPNSANERPLVLAGKGRLVTTCAEDFALSGVSSIAAEPVTLTLDGTNGKSRLNAVSNGTSAVSLVKEGPGTWTLSGQQTFSGALDVREGVLEVEGMDIPYTWYKLIIKTLNSYYSGDNDSCRVTQEFALYDADGVRQNVNLTVTQAEATAIQPGEATVVEPAVRNYSNGSWAFTNPSFYLPNMFDDNAGTASFLAGPGNGITSAAWVSVVMRPREGTPPIVACDMISSNGKWNQGNRRTVAYSVLGSYDGVAWTELTNQTTNETARFTSGWYSDGTSFKAGEIRKLSEGHGIAIAPYPSFDTRLSQLENVSSITVAAGATLRAKGTVSLAKLNLDLADSAGTIEGFSVAENGELHVTGKLGRDTEFPYTFTDMKNMANFSSWALYENGAPSKKKIVLRAGNKLAAESPRFVLIVK